MMRAAHACLRGSRWLRASQGRRASGSAMLVLVVAFG